MEKWESEKHKSWGIPAEGFKGHVATDGSLLGTVGKWRACGWSVVQLDYGEDLGPLHGMYVLVPEDVVGKPAELPTQTIDLCGELRKIKWKWQRGKLGQSVNGVRESCS